MSTNINIQQLFNFKLGYPYNNEEVDKNFKPLSSEIIKRFGYSIEEQKKISSLQNDLQQIDRNLNDLVIKLSTFIISFEDVSEHLIISYDKLLLNKKELNSIIDIHEATLSKNNTMLENLELYMTELKKDIDELKEQIDADSVSTIDIEEMRNDLTESISTFEGVLTELETDINTHESNLNTISNDISQTFNKISDITFEKKLILDYYESWMKYGEVYKEKLDYFENDYCDFWTDAKVNLYKKVLETQKSEAVIERDITDKYQSYLFRVYDLELKKRLCVEQLSYLQNRTDLDIDEYVYNNSIRKRSFILEQMREVEEKLNGYKSNLKKLVNDSDLSAYYQHKELVLSFVQYRIKNLPNNEDEKYISMKEEIIQSHMMFQNIEEQINKADYIRNKNQMESYGELYEYLKTQYNLVSEKINNHNKSDVLKKETMSDIQTVEQELIDKTLKLKHLKKEYDELVIDNHRVENDLNLNKSEILTIENELNRIENGFMEEFDRRISFYNQNLDNTIEESIIEIILEGFNIKEINDWYRFKGSDDIIKYKNEWFDMEGLLTNHYENLISDINILLTQQWQREFKHNILVNMRIKLLTKIINEKLIEIYALSHYDIRNETDEHIETIKEIEAQLVNLINNQLKITLEGPEVIDLNLDFYNYESTTSVEINSLSMLVDIIKKNIEILTEEIEKTQISKLNKIEKEKESEAIINFWNNR